MTRYYSKEHEWIEVNGDEATMGITTHAAEQLGELVYIELADRGSSCSAGDTMGVIESVKAASDIFAPLSCSVLEANNSVVDNPQLVADDAEGTGWLYRLKIDKKEELDHLMDQAAYEAMIS